MVHLLEFGSKALGLAIWILFEVPLGVSPVEATLPKTGETSHLNVEIAGIFLIILGFGIRRFVKR
jgi:LPXTG-motif cell wall-anchored protein